MLTCIKFIIVRILEKENILFTQPLLTLLYISNGFMEYIVAKLNSFIKRHITNSQLLNFLLLVFPVTTKAVEFVRIVTEIMTKLCDNIFRCLSTFGLLVWFHSVFEVQSNYFTGCIKLYLFK